MYQAIWDTILNIPIGRVASYGQIARLIGKPRHARQVSYALARSSKLCPALNLPWHRVLKSDGKIAFDKGDWRFEEQIHLLSLEKVVVEAGRVDLTRYGWQPLLE